MKILKLSSEIEEEGIFSTLPPEIIHSILSRVPIKTVFTCKCVCKSWLGLLETPDFARSHLSNSVPGLLINRVVDTDDSETNVFKIFEFEDSLEIDRHERHYKKVLDLKWEDVFGDGPDPVPRIDGSTDGLLFFRSQYSFQCPDDCCICNPITHEFIELPEPEGIHMNGHYGFGVSRLSNQYKVVKLCKDGIRGPDTGSMFEIPMVVLQVYTLGKGSWRCITAPCEILLDYGCCSTGKLLNGNLHWLTGDFEGSLWISCFDLETEVFTKFRAPTVESGKGYQTELGVLRDRLCLSDYSSHSEIVIHLMTNVGDETRSWNKEYVLSKIPFFSGKSLNDVYAVKAFGDGDLLLAWDHISFLCYSNRTKTIALVDVLNEDVIGFEAILYTPSFISLKDFETENAIVFDFECFMN